MSSPQQSYGNFPPQGFVASPPLTNGVGGAPKAHSPPHLGEPHSLVNQAGSGAGSVTLNVSNLPPQADVAMLHELFSPFGHILSAQIDVDTSSGGQMDGSRVSVCSGRGYVQVAGMAQAVSAVQAVHGSCFNSDIPIQVKRWRLLFLCQCLFDFTHWPHTIIFHTHLQVMIAGSS